MKIQLADSIWLKSVSGNQPVRAYCSWSRERISGLYVYIDPSADTSALFVSQARIALNRVTELASALRQFDPSEHGSKHILQNKVVYVESVDFPEDEYYSCPICGSPCEAGDACLLINTTYTHMNCVDELVSVLESVWDDYSDEMLSHGVDEL